MTSHHTKFQLDSSKRSQVIPLQKSINDDNDDDDDEDDDDDNNNNKTITTMGKREDFNTA